MPRPKTRFQGEDVKVFVTDGGASTAALAVPVRGGWRSLLRASARQRTYPHEQRGATVRGEVIDTAHPAARAMTIMIVHNDRNDTRATHAEDARR